VTDHQRNSEPRAEDVARPDPRAEYAARLDARAAAAIRARTAETRVARARLFLFVAAAAAIWGTWGGLPAPLLIGLPILCFVALVILHQRARTAVARAERAVAWYERGLDRLEGRFAGVGEAGGQWLDETHPYASHLDLFGDGSLYQLLCGARTSAGRETLASWLLEPAPPDEIRARQEAATELRGRLDLREDLATLDEDVVDALRSEDLAAWAEAPSPLSPGGFLRIAALGLASSVLATAAAAPWIGTPPFAWLVLLELALWWRLRKRAGAVIASVEGPAIALRRVRDALARIEAEAFACERLHRIDAALGAHDSPASERLGRLLGRVDRLEWRENQFFALFAALLLWGTNWAFAIERWRAEHGREIRGWIAAVGELEALVDLSRFAYERPGYVFPDVEPGEAHLEAVRLAHPLLPVCTPNDVALGGTLRLLVVTGSNMSGKSTLLRTIGVNVVLAQAGAPVRAASLAMSPLSPGASIRTVDSLLDGASRFYAEIRAIKRAMDRAETHPPGLFLLDELLHGTNSEDRRAGAEAIVRAFLRRDAIGVVTTHDLALARIAEHLGERAANAHFEFALDGEEIRFDYTLHPGVVKAGNALAIMRAAGLEV